MKKILIAVAVIVLVEIILGVLYLNFRKPEAPLPDIKDIEVINEPVPEGSIMLLSDLQSGKTVKVGDEVVVNAHVSSKQMSSAADLSLRFDPTLLQLKNERAPFSSGSAYQRNVFNKGDSRQGLATMSAVSDVNKSFSGSAILGSITFVALKTGSTQVGVNFYRGDTRDSNIVVSGKDILQSVKDLTIQIIP